MGKDGFKTHPSVIKNYSFLLNNAASKEITHDVRSASKRHPHISKLSLNGFNFYLCTRKASPSIPLLTEREARLEIFISICNDKLKYITMFSMYSIVESQNKKIGFALLYRSLSLRRSLAVGRQGIRRMRLMSSDRNVQASDTTKVEQSCQCW